MNSKLWKVSFKILLVLYVAFMVSYFILKYIIGVNIAAKWIDIVAFWSFIQLVLIEINNRAKDKKIK